MVAPRCLQHTGLALTCALLFWTNGALAQSWTGNRATPSLSQIVAVDRTGEPGWPYGSEDVAGDGAVFQQPEQAIDIRSAYAATTAQDFFVRVYVSATTAPGAMLSAFVFVDSDLDAGTGGSAAADEIDARFASDPSAGGYEYVVGVQGNEMLLGIWEWQAAQGAFASVTTTPMQFLVEAGVDSDPLALNGADHGYVQAQVDRTLLGLTEVCAANLFFRSLSDDPALGDGDVDVGRRGPCVPDDGNANGVPDVLVPPAGCSSDAECPAQGVCIAGSCRLTSTCATDADCAGGDVCTTDGRCVAGPGGSCSDTAECAGLVCSSGQCIACTPGGSECGAGRLCGPDGRCTDAAPDEGPSLAPGEEVQGGACACRAGRATPGGQALLLAIVPLALAFARRRRCQR